MRPRPNVVQDDELMMSYRGQSILATMLFCCGLQNIVLASDQMLMAPLDSLMVLVGVTVVVVVGVGVAVEQPYQTLVSWRSLFRL